MQTTFANRAAALLIAAAGAVHLALVPEYLGEKPYVGALFAAGGLACAWWPCACGAGTMPWPSRWAPPSRAAWPSASC